MYLRYNNTMSDTSLPAATHTELAGLTYRIRRGADAGLGLIMFHGLGGDEHVMGIFANTLKGR